MSETAVNEVVKEQFEKYWKTYGNGDENKRICELFFKAGANTILDHILNKIKK